MNSEMIRILLVEDDPNLGFLVQDSLEAKGYNVTLCADGLSGWNNFQNGRFDLCILDVMLPQMDGFTLGRKIRKMNVAVPIIFLTAKARQEDKIKGLTLGADDYLTKPFSLEELQLRLKNLLKRTTTQMAITVANSGKISFGNCELDAANQLLTVNQIPQKLTQKETDIIRMLCENQNTILKRDAILKAIWEDNGYFVARSLDVFISKIRKYLKPDESLRITSIHGVGYKLEVLKTAEITSYK